MEIITWALLSIFIVLTIAVIGFAISSRSIQIAWYHIVALVVLTYMTSLASAFLGHLLGSILSYRFFEVVIGLVFIGIGGFLVISKPIYPGHKELLLLSLVMFMDVYLFNYRYALTHEESGYGLAFTMTLLATAGIVVGMVLGAKKWQNWRLRLVIPHLSGVCICLIGVLKVL